jgi:hypothetical protein
VISALDRAPFDVLVSDIATSGDDGYDLILVLDQIKMAMMSVVGK